MIISLFEVKRVLEQKALQVTKRFTSFEVYQR